MQCCGKSRPRADGELRANANLSAINHLHARVCTFPFVGTIVMHAHHSHSTRHFAAERHSADVEHWARIEGKSETMSAELLESASPIGHAPEASRIFCPQCLTSATVGAALALLIDRLIAIN